jgi:hypothetical protein
MARVRITHIQAEAPSLNKKQRKAWKKRIKRSISCMYSQYSALQAPPVYETLIFLVSTPFFLSSLPILAL